MRRFEILEKFYSSKTLLKMAGGGMHTQHTPYSGGNKGMLSGGNGKTIFKC